MPGPYASLPAPGAAGALPQKQVVTSVGYGICVPGEGLRRPASKGGTCSGDSGGPSLVGDTIMGTAPA